MPDQTPPGIAARLLAKSEDDRKKNLDVRHPAYEQRHESWQIQLDAFEGSGGFLTGEYLWPHVKESADDFNRRKSMARYHNYVETLVDLYVRFMFTQGVRRESTDARYNQWLENVDGAGTTINELLKKFAAIALVPGHAGLLIDKTMDAPEGPSRADERSQVFATIFPATSIADWRYDRNQLTAVKLIETAPPTSLDDEESDGEDQQYLLWDTEGWARFTEDGKPIATGEPMLGLVPLVILRPKPSFLAPMLGRALISNVNVVRALFNRAAEEDEVLRNQAFSLLTVNVPSDGDVQAARTQLGTTMGSAKALVVQGQIDYKTPDQNVPAAIRENITYLTEEIYRAAHMRSRRDSLASETAEAIRLQHTELNEMLQGFSKSLAQAEKQIARAWFAWTEPTQEAAEAAFERAQVEAVYPDEFFLDALINDLEAWAEAIRLDLGDTMTKRIKKRAARRVDPEMPPEVLKMVDDEIDAQDTQRLMGFPLDTGQVDDGVPAGQPAT